MSSERTVSRITWRAKPCGWRDRERVVALGEEFGPAGPLLLDVLEELAKEQRGDGEVRTGLRALVRAVHVPRGGDGIGLVKRMLTFAESIKALDDLGVEEGVDMTVTCRVSGFAADQGRGYEAVKKSWQRSDSPETRDNGTVSPLRGDNDLDSPDSRDGVPGCPPTGQDRTEEDRKEESPPTPKGGNRVRDKQQFDLDVQAWSRSVLGIEDEEGWRNVRGAILAGARSVDDVVAWLKEWRPDVLPAGLAA